MQALFHPDVVAFDLPAIRKALTKRGIRIEFDSAWKSFQQALVTRIGEKKAPGWETDPQDDARFYRLILPLSTLTINAYLQLRGGKLLVWVLAVGGRMDIPYNLGKRRDVTAGGVTFTYPPDLAFTPNP